MAATRSKTTSDSKRGNFEEDDVQMPLKLVKVFLKQQESEESTLKVFLSFLIKDVQSVKTIVRENRADLTDRGRPIPSIFLQCNTFHQQC